MPETDHDDVVAGYAHLMDASDHEGRKRSANEWCVWEDTIISQEPNGAANVYAGRLLDEKRSFVRIASHYCSNGV